MKLLTVQIFNIYIKGFALLLVLRVDLLLRVERYPEQSFELNFPPSRLVVLIIGKVVERLLGVTDSFSLS
jgi:hypothetical protein